MNKITKEFLESEIISVEYTRLQGTLTHCAITVKSGFVFTGESACVDPNNFDRELGEKFAYEQALDQMWMPYGFWLHKVLSDFDKFEPGTGREEVLANGLKQLNQSNILPKTERLSFGDAIAALKKGLRVERAGWNGKGMFLFLVNGEAVTEAIEDHYGDPEAKGVHKVHDAIYMHTAQGDLVPWLASQTDVLAEDWHIVE